MPLRLNPSAVFRPSALTPLEYYRAAYRTARRIAGDQVDIGSSIVAGFGNGSMVAYGVDDGRDIEPVWEALNREGCTGYFAISFMKFRDGDSDPGSADTETLVGEFPIVTVCAGPFRKREGFIGHVYAVRNKDLILLPTSCDLSDSGPQFMLIYPTVVS